MGKRKRDRQATMWVTTADLPTVPKSPLYRRLNQSLRNRATVHDLETLEIRT